MGNLIKGHLPQMSVYKAAVIVHSRDRAQGALLLSQRHAGNVLYNHQMGSRGAHDYWQQPGLCGESHSITQASTLPFSITHLSGLRHG